MARGSDVTEGTLPLGAVLFKVVVGSTLEAMPVVKGTWVMCPSGGGGRSGGRGPVGGRVGSRGRGAWGAARSISCCRKDRQNHPSELHEVIGVKCEASANWRGYGAETLQWSGDHWHGSDGDGRDLLMDRGVNRGRNNGRVHEKEEFALLCQILSLVDFREEEEGGVKEGLEELGGETSLKELYELSQHEELQELEPHDSKTV